MSKHGFRWSAIADRFVFLLVTLSMALMLSAPMGARADLARVGPTQLPSPPGNGYPAWYQDLNGTVLDLCMPNADDLNQLQAQACLLVPGGLNPPYEFPTNYPDEGFYFNAGATMDMPNGSRAVLVLAVEAAFANGPVVPGDQVVFTRIRVISGVPSDGNYRVTHPYGTETFNGVQSSGGNRDIVFTEDVGLAAGIFTGALKSRVGPFLRPADGLGNPLPPVVINGAEFLTDGLGTTQVTGSPFGTNYFEICGPMNGPGTDVCVRTDQFSIIGRLHDHVNNPIGSPVSIGRAIYSRDASGTHVDVVANAVKGIGQADPRLSVGGDGLPSVLMNGPNAIGNFYAQGVPATGVPSTVTVVNFGDVPSSSFTTAVSDDVIITSAQFDPTTLEGDGSVSGTLTVVATSSDKGTATEPVPALTLVEYPTAIGTKGVISGDPASVGFTVPGVKVTPAIVNVRSSVGGEGSRPVSMAKSLVAFTPGTPLARDDSASAEASDTVPTVIPVLANDSANPAAPINPATVAVLAPGLTPGMGSLTVNPDGSISFLPSQVAGTATFKYQVSNAVGASNPATVTINVTPPANGGPVPIANNDPNAGSTISVNVGASVEIDVLANDLGNGGTLDPTSVAITTPPATGSTLIGTNTGRITYTASTTAGVVTFAYTVKNLNGNTSAPATVTVNVVQPEVLATTRAQCRQSRADWDVRGTSTVLPDNSVEIYLTPTVPDAPTPAQILGTALIDPATGTFQFRLRGATACQPTISWKSKLGNKVNNVSVTLN